MEQKFDKGIGYGKLPSVAVMLEMLEELKQEYGREDRLTAELTRRIREKYGIEVTRAGVHDKLKRDPEGAAAINYTPRGNMPILIAEDRKKFQGRKLPTGIEMIERKRLTPKRMEGAACWGWPLLEHFHLPKFIYDVLPDGRMAKFKIEREIAHG